MDSHASAPTFALILGVSNTQFPQFAPLPAAKADAKHLARSLIQWGVPEKNIVLLLDPTREQFERSLNQLGKLSGPFLFYFCGHGDRIEDQSSLIFSDGEVNLETLLQRLYQLNTTALYLFIDACHLRLNTILNPKLLDSSRTLFCLLSSGIYPSFESVQYGFFTTALIKALGVIRELDRSPTRLLSLIQKELAFHDLHQPEMYNIGTDKIDIFPVTETSELKKAISSVYSCGIFIDKELFCEVFGVETETLEKLGLIFYEKGSWHPHPSLIELAEEEAVPIEGDLAKIYWAKQLENQPGHVESALHFVMTQQCFGYSQKFDRLLIAAYQTLAKDPTTLPVLEKCASFYFDILPPSAEVLAEIFIENLQVDLAKPLLKPHTSAYLHFLWRTGAYSECIEEDQIYTPTDRFHRGTAHYFLGNWKEAYTDFSFIQSQSKETLTICKARCMLGTIDGIRGINFKNSCLTVESATRILQKRGDLLSAWVGWNNLGEMLWKAKELKAAQKHLLYALEISEKIDNRQLLLETLRNLLQLELRKPDRSKAKIISLLNQIEPLLELPIEPFVTIQLYNTLCTISHFLNLSDRAQEYLRKAIPLTALSKEYHIYTLSNISLLNKSNTHFEQALALAKKGNNLFAIEQVKQDHLLRAF